jgi:CubicO group peptidase (beta-lactamase class C family)
MTKIYKFGILIGTVACLITCTSPETNQDGRLNAYIDSLTRECHFNGNLLVGADNEIVFKGCYGLANFDTKDRLNDSSIFLLCSISKQFTAMGIMLLKEKGMLSYDDNIVKYIPELPYDGISIRNMLTHTSGLPKYDELLEKRIDKNSVAHNDDIIKMLQEVKPPLLFHPGEQWEYCDTAYELLATVIEKVSGVSYSEFLNKNIFKPLKMNHTFNCITRRSNKQTIKNYALPFIYSDSLKKYVMPESLPQHHMVITLDGTQGAGSINSTIEDMYKWDRGLRTERLIKNATLDEAFTPTRLNDGQTYNYGFGWFLDKSQKNSVAMHPGGWPGYKTSIIRGLDNNHFVIVLSNNESDSHLLAKNIFDKINGIDQATGLHNVGF